MYIYIYMDFHKFDRAFYIYVVFQYCYSKFQNFGVMKATLKYLAGIAGPSGYGSKTTAEQATKDFSNSSNSQLTAIITGN